jgi:hypothetical protein
LDIEEENKRLVDHEVKMLNNISQKFYPAELEFNIVEASENYGYELLRN